jgi:hypothetical protein
MPEQILVVKTYLGFETSKLVRFVNISFDILY